MTENAGAAVKAGAVVARDTERFRFLYKNGRPVIPADYSAPATMSFIRVLIDERVNSQACTPQTSKA